jgi:hypothetical protein
MNTQFPPPESFRHSVCQQFGLEYKQAVNEDFDKEYKKMQEKQLASQAGSTHYVTKTIQPWTAMESWMSSEEFEGFLRGNVIKYIARYKDKDGIKDLLKARHYLEKLLECLETRNQDASKT